MHSLRDVLRNSLRNSLGGLTPQDRLAAAWPVAAGHAIAERSTVTGIDGTRVLVEVTDDAWLPELRAMTPRLSADLARVSGVPVTDILFLAATSDRPARNPRAKRPESGTQRSS